MRTDRAAHAPSAAGYRATSPEDWLSYSHISEDISAVARCDRKKLNLFKGAVQANRLNRLDEAFVQVLDLESLFEMCESDSQKTGEGK
jgi:hypothetical protein